MKIELATHSEGHAVYAYATQKNIINETSGKALGS
jgi:hypothetical protein